jgi:hypothetical protein
MSHIHQVILYDFWDFTTISGVSGDFRCSYVLTNHGDPHGYRDAWGRRIAAQ